MKLKIIDIVDPLIGEIKFNEWHQQTPGVRVSTKHLVPHPPPARQKYTETFTEGWDRLYIFYETAEDVQYGSNLDLIAQNSQIEMCKDIAKVIWCKEMAQYTKLKNTAQRRAWLLETHYIPAKDADMVHELLQMYDSGALPAPRRES